MSLAMRPRRAASTSSRPRRAETAEPASARGVSIRVASRVTSIEPDTLRMWERRYGFPSPTRTEGGSRLYAAHDIEKLQLITKALEVGYRPGEVVGLDRKAIERAIEAADAPPSRRVARVAPAAPTVQGLLDKLARDEVQELRVGLRQAAITLGPKRFVVDVARPLAIEVGERWSRGELEVRHEHLLTECLSTQIRAMLSAFEEVEAAPIVLLATLSGEPHGLGLEMIALYLAVSHVSPRLLGIDTPADQIVKAARGHRADIVALAVSPVSANKATAKTIRSMLDELPRSVGLWVGGGGAEALGLDHRDIRIVGSWDDLDQAIAKARSRAN